jgi:hypothetical protein
VSGTALALVLPAAFCHAIWNIAAKRVTGDGYLFVWWYDLWSTVLWAQVGIVLLAQAGWPWSWGLLYGPLVSAVIHIAYQLSLQRATTGLTLESSLPSREVLALS